MQHLRAAFWAALSIVFIGAPLCAQDVTLTSRDGTVEISGALVGYDGEFFRVETVYGILTIDGSGVLCDGPGCPDLASYVANVRFSGAGSVGSRLMPGLVDAFALENGYQVSRRVEDDENFSLSLTDVATGALAAEFRFKLSTSDEGFADLLADEADVVLSTREVTEEEVSRGIAAGMGQLGASNQTRVLALDALVPVVSPNNSISVISPSDLYAVYSGEISNWQDLGGVDAPIELFLPEDSFGLTQVFQRYLDYNKAKLTSGKMHRSSVESMLSAVAGDPFAMGIAVASDTGNARALTLIGRCGFVAGVSPFSLKTEDYPLAAPVFAYVPSRRFPAAAREFLRFIRSSSAQAAVGEVGFSNQLLTERPISMQGDRLNNAIRAAGEEISLQDLQHMVSVLDGYRRLSVSFRFEGGSSVLDAQSRSNILLLARAAEAGTFDGRELMFVGFSDGEGSATANLRLSRLRAASVRTAVMQEATTADPTRIEVRVEAFGESMPMACDDTEWGRGVNRRVEVWIK